MTTKERIVIMSMIVAALIMSLVAARCEEPDTFGRGVAHERQL